jgi:hypothetical protein
MQPVQRSYKVIFSEALSRKTADAVGNRGDQLLEDACTYFFGAIVGLLHCYVFGWF